MTAIMIRSVTRRTIAAIVLALAAGCGTTGTTTRFRLALDPATPVSGAASLRVAPATMDADAPRLYAIKVKEWGRFKAEDLANIEQSLVDTLAAGRAAHTGDAEPKLAIHLRVRRYLVAVSNTGGAVLACVAWAAATPSGDIVLQEQFYATGSGAYVGTIGGLKDRVHRAVVRRIATTALYLAADRGADTAHPTEFEGTYAELEDAIASLPQEMVSRGNPAAMANPVPATATTGTRVAMAAVAVAGALEVTATGAPPWEAARPPADLDWAAVVRTAGGL